jgi:hypothetical protein
MRVNVRDGGQYTGWDFEGVAPEARYVRIIAVDSALCAAR